MQRALAFVCPTLNRQELHPQLHATFSAQTVAPKHLYVLDESAQPSPYFSSLRDKLVTYVHRVGKPRVGGVTRIGAARNALNAMVREPFIQHIDDDDWLDPDFGATMLSRLGDADLCKLDVWRLLSGDTVLEWDTRTMGGRHFAMRGDSIEPVDDVTADMTPEERAAYRDAFHVGFGWSFCYPKRTWERMPFPEEGTEDIPWVRALRSKGARIVFVSDCARLALHVVHADPNHGEGGSPHFPQKLLGKLRAEVKQRMLGAGAPMEELPQGKAISIEPGKLYTVIAAIKQSHSLKSIATRAKGWGIDVQEAQDNLSPEEAGVEAPPQGYRLVRISGMGSSPVTMPWRAPKMLRAIGEKSHAVRAWVGAGAAADDNDEITLRAFVGAGSALAHPQPLELSAQQSLAELRAFARTLTERDRQIMGITAHLTHAEEAIAGGDFARAMSHIQAAAPMMRTMGAGGTPIERRIERMKERLTPPQERPMIPSYAAAIFAGRTLGAGAAADDMNPSRYDPARFAGREPPHKCTAKSATAIAQQLPGAPWAYERSFAPMTVLPWPTTEREYNVVTGMGAKKIPAWYTNDGARLSLTCPYTGERFVFVHGTPR